MIDIFVILSFIGVAIGSLTDIKTLEVPDWLNYSLIATGFGGNLIFTFFYNDFSFIQRSLIGFAAAFLVGMAMYYTGQWGGGDSKMLFGLGAMFGLEYPFSLSFFPSFIINLLMFGAIYGLGWIIVLAFLNRKKINKAFVKELGKNKKIRVIYGVACIVVACIVYILPLMLYLKIVLLILIITFFLSTYLIVYVRMVEKISMVKMIDPIKLTEGDWIVDEIKVDGKIIAGPKDLGIRKEQISKLLEYKHLKKIRKVKVKYGIPFVPSFFLALTYTMIFSDVLMFSLL